MATGLTHRNGQHKKATDLAKLNGSPTFGRSALVNHFNSAAARLPDQSAFLPQNLWPWIRDYLKYAFTRRFPFPDYTNSGKTGVYAVAPGSESGEVTIALAGDWGTGTQEAQTIADLMCNNKTGVDKPDFTIHLGDVYYVGDDREIAENCFGQSSGGFQGVCWPHGRRGSFSLNGNHEMYANGKPYFTKFLPSLGMSGSGGQVASFFSLETDHWRVLAIDTGYNCVGIPILSQIPGINQIPFIGGDCHLEKRLLDWLRNVVKPRENPKATLLLSHHEYFTAFSDHDYTKPAKQLVEFFQGQELVWIWGHEHRLAIYDKFRKDGGITVFGRCVGHSGMPVDLGAPNPGKAPLRYYDPRSHNLDDGTPVGENGYANITIRQAELTVEYRDIHDNRLLIETFTRAANGALDYVVDDSAGILKKL